MTEFDAFYPYIQLNAQGVSDPLMKRAVRNACIDFCHQSLLINKTLDPVSVTENITEYDIDVPDGCTIVQIQRAWFLGRPLVVENPEEEYDPKDINPAYPNANVTSSTPQKITYTGLSSFQLAPPPNESLASAVTLRAVLKPSRDCSELADEFDILYEDYVEAIAAGALSKLLDTRDMPFYDPKAASTKMVDFNIGINDAKLRSKRGLIGRRTLRVRIPRI